MKLLIGKNSTFNFTSNLSSLVQFLHGGKMEPNNLHGINKISGSWNFAHLGGGERHGSMNKLINIHEDP